MLLSNPNALPFGTRAEDSEMNTKLNRDFRGNRFLLPYNASVC